MLRSRQILAVSRASRTSAFRLIRRMRQRVSAVPDRNVFQVLERRFGEVISPRYGSDVWPALIQHLPADRERLGLRPRAAR